MDPGDRGTSGGTVATLPAHCARLVDELARRRCADDGAADFDSLPGPVREHYLRDAAGTVQTILGSGYTISVPDELRGCESLDAGDLQGLRFRDLFDLYRRRQAEWRSEPGNFLRVGEAFLKRSEPVVAYEVFQAGIDVVEGAAAQTPELRKRLLQRSAQALADAMAVRESERILLALYHGGARDGETLGMLAKVHKKLAIMNADPAQLQLALALYLEGFDEAERRAAADDAIYNGINAATMARLDGNVPLSAGIVARVRQLCEDKPDKSYWDLASLGECSLLDADMGAASKWYRLAAGRAPLRDRLSMRQQAQLICSRLGMDGEVLEQIFAPPKVIVFSGHRIDDSRNPFVRFPAEHEPEMRRKIGARIEQLRPGFAYCSAACGSDILFIEELLRRNAEVHVYLPFPAEQFAAEFVAYAGESWLQRFRVALRRADSVTTVSHWDIGLNDKSHAFCNLYILGAALLQHERTGCDIHGVAVWDGLDEPACSGTAAVLELWRGYGLEWSVIEPAGRGHFDPFPPPDGDGDVSRHTYLPMLFADVKGYSRLTGLQLYIFSRRFMDACAAIIDARRPGIFSTRTAGDGLFIAFNDLDSAIDTARTLRDMIATTDWSRSGLPADLSARFALDCGPCYSYVDPVTSRLELCGAHVIRAARLEPVTPPGHIYASESFAAMCAARKIPVRFEAAGRIMLPKDFGEMRVYHLH